MGEKTCGTCRFWYKAPADPLNLTAPTQGECREGPPACTAVVDARGQIHRVMLHPLLPDAYPACGRHAVEVATG